MSLPRSIRLPASALCAAVFLTASLNRADAAETDAPFGFSWGQSASQISEMTSLNLDDIEPNGGRIRIFEIERAPITPPDTQVFVLSVDQQFGLSRITWLSQPIMNDTSGLDGKEKFNKMKEMLTEKYGQTIAGAEKLLQEDPNKFYSCLALDRCGLWFAAWQSQAMTIILRLKGLASDAGLLTVHYEGPDWSKIVEDIEQSEEQLKKDAF